MIDRSVKALLLASLIFVFSFHEALAYLDPGTGSIILQAIIGGIAGSTIVIKIYWHKIKKLFANERESEKKPES